VSVRILHGDCLEVLKTLADNSVDAVVTDPPYGIRFMGKAWDGADIDKKHKERKALASRAEGSGPNGGYRSAAAEAGKYDITPSGMLAFQEFTLEYARECLRVLKPGGHLASFSSTRTYHRMACAIEDAGFEVRDSLYWHYGQGFPKSRNIIKDLQDSGLSCTCHKSMISNHHVSDENLRDLQNALDAHNAVSGDPEPDMRSSLYGGADRAEGQGEAIAAEQAGDDFLRGMRQAASDAAIVASQGGDSDVLQALQWSAARGGMGETRIQGQRSDNARGQSAETCGFSVGEEPRLEGRRDAEASSRELCGGSLHQIAGMGEVDGESGRLHHGASARDGEDVRLPADSDGGRESQEPASRSQRTVKLGVVADERRPQAWGGWPVCDGCGKPMVPEGLGTALKPATEPICLARKPLSEKTVAANVLRWGTGAINVDGCRVHADDAQGGKYTVKRLKPGATRNATGGNWRPDEGVEYHDGSQEVLDLLPSPHGAGAAREEPGGGEFKSDKGWGNIGAGNKGFRVGDSGSAARFFYCAKASKADRAGSKHPTVKPIKLMQWLCRLITPPGGVVLDPFAGSGTTGAAAILEGFGVILIEREAEYIADIVRRLDSVADAPLFSQAAE
jgi:DNA modification methylase